MVQKFISREISLLFFIYIFNVFFRFLIFNELSIFPEFKCPPPSVDSDFYIYIAKFINEGIPFVSKEAYYYSPFYSHLVALSFSIFGENIFILKLINIFTGSTVPIAIYFISKLYLKNSKIALFLAVLSSFYDLFVIYDLQLLKTSLGITFLFWGFYFLSLYFKNEKGSILILSGILFGIGSLIYVNFLLVLVVFCFYLLFKYKLKVFYFGIPILLIIGSSMIRNYLIVQDIIPVTSIGGIHFYIGNSSKSVGIYTHVKGIRASGFGHYFDGRKIAEKETGKKLKPSEVSKFWKKKAIEEIKENPSHFIKLIFRKILYTVNYFDVPNNINKNYIKKKTFIFKYFTISFGIFSLFGLVGFILSLKEKEFLLIHIFFVVYFLTVVMFFVTDRYRLPLILPLILYSGYLIKHIFQNKNFYKRITVLILLTFISVPVFYPTDISKLNFEKNIKKREFFSSRLYSLNQKIEKAKDKKIKSSLITKKAEIYRYTRNFEQAYYLLSKAIKLNPKNRKAKMMLKSIKRHVPVY